MIVSTLSSAELGRHQVRLQHFLRWLSVVVFGFALLYSCLFLALHDLVLGISAPIGWAYGSLLLVARSYTLRGKLQLAVALSGGGFLVVATIFAVIYPAVYPTLAVIPLLVVTSALPYVTRAALRKLILACGLVVGLVVMLGEYVQLLPAPPAGLTNLVQVVSLVALIALTLLLLWQFSGRLSETMIDLQSANQVLQTTQVDLEQSLTVQAAALAEVAARAAAQEHLLRENAEQRMIIHDLSAPVIPVLPGVLVAPLVGELHDERVERLTAHILKMVEQRRATHLILDVTGLSMLSEPTAQVLLRMAAAARLLGAQVLLAGTRPDVAQTLVLSQLDLSGLKVHADLESALEGLFMRRLKAHYGASIIG